MGPSITVLKVLRMVGGWRTRRSKEMDRVEINGEGIEGGMFAVYVRREIGGTCVLEKAPQAGWIRTAGCDRGIKGSWQR